MSFLYVVAIAYFIVLSASGIVQVLLSRSSLRRRLFGLIGFLLGIFGIGLLLPRTIPAPFVLGTGILGALLSVVSIGWTIRMRNSTQENR
jgi:hypothetical protein